MDGGSKIAVIARPIERLREAPLCKTPLSQFNRPCPPNPPPRPLSSATHPNGWIVLATRYGGTRSPASPVVNWRKTWYRKRFWRHIGIVGSLTAGRPSVRGSFPFCGARSSIIIVHLAAARRPLTTLCSPPRKHSRRNRNGRHHPRAGRPHQADVHGGRGGRVLLARQGHQPVEGGEVAWGSPIWAQPRLGPPQMNR